MKAARVINLITGGLACGLMFSGCGTRHPSTAGQQALNKAAAVRSDMEAAKTHMENVSEAVKAAGGDNAELKDLVDRMERKNIIIDRWIETHPPSSKDSGTSP